MIKHGPLFSFFILFSYSVANAQTYVVSSFEGRKVEIKLNSKLFTKTLSISCLKDTVHLSDFTGLRQAKVVNNKFLQILYGVRGGSGLDLRKIIILSVCKNKIFVPLLVTSYSNATGLNDKKFYTLTLKHIGSNKNKYEIVANIKETQKSTIQPQLNKSWSGRALLKFDTTRNIFYNSYTDFSKKFHLFDIKTSQTVKLQVKGNLPTIKLGKNSYIYLNEQWYDKSDEDRLSKYYFKND